MEELSQSTFEDIWANLEAAIESNTVQLIWEMSRDGAVVKTIRCNLVTIKKNYRKK